MDGAQTFHNATNSMQARTVAEVFGSLTSGFEFFDLDRLYITIPGFHDLSLRFHQFKQSLHSKKYDRLLKAAPLIDQLKKREGYVSFFEVMTESEEFEKRLMHHDAKISNILFDEETGKVICPVDFDTCMPGYFFSDFGDMIRSMACSEDESSTNYNDINIRRDFYEAILEGYLEVMHELLTDSEKKYIHYSGLLIIYMQALRFLADYLNGDVYYKTTYPEQNFDRAKNQLTLLQRLEEFLSANYQYTIFSTRNKNFRKIPDLFFVMFFNFHSKVICLVTLYQSNGTSTKPRPGHPCSYTTVISFAKFNNSIQFFT
jgi:thiamine kinase-like enzyme